MEIVNCRVAHIRPKYANLKEWMADSGDNEYIGRAGIVFVDGERWPKRSSTWANPFKLHRDGSLGEILARYEDYIRERLDTEPRLRSQLLELHGKRLGCWCAPEPCHGDVLVKLIRELQEK